jgi:hypothetical protein
MFFDVEKLSDMYIKLWQEQYRIWLQKSELLKYHLIKTELPPISHTDDE